MLFPGQGAQVVGMGLAAAAAHAPSRDALREADEALGWSLSRLIEEGPADRLAETEITQPAILAASIAVYRLAADRGLKPSALAGLSLGEWTAHVVAGSLDYPETVRVVNLRGKFMQEAVPLGHGAMAAIIGLERGAVEEACRRASSDGVVAPANYNCPGQIVISGNAAAVTHAVALCKDAGARRAVMLPVSAPFHSPLMKPAAERLAAVMAEVTVREASVPVVANVHAGYVRQPSEVVDSLIRQVAAPVLFDDSITRLIEDGFTHFLEVGPGSALTGFVRRVSKDVHAANIETPEDLERVLEAWGGALLICS